MQDKMQLLKSMQLKEIKAVEEAHKIQYNESVETWEKYMSNYEEASIKILQGLKEKQVKEATELEQKFRDDANKKAKYSGSLIELRKKEQALVKMLKYKEAEKIKKEADELEMKELYKLENDVNETVKKRLAKIRQAHEMEINVVLKRIQRDRNDHMKEKARSLERLIQKNKNLILDLTNRHVNETKKLELDIRKGLYEFKIECKLIQKSKTETSPMKPKISRSPSKA